MRVGQNLANDWRNIENQRRNLYWYLIRQQKRGSICPRSLSELHRSACARLKRVRKGPEIGIQAVRKTEIRFIGQTKENRPEKKQGQK